MEKLTGLLKNVKGGPVTTAVGVVLMALGGYMMYEIGFEDIEYTSLPVGVMFAGVYMLVSKDVGK